MESRAGFARGVCSELKPGGGARKAGLGGGPARVFCEKMLVFALFFLQVTKKGIPELGKGGPMDLPKKKIFSPMEGRNI